MQLHTSVAAEKVLERLQEVLGIALENKKEFPAATPVGILQKRYPDKTVALIGIDLAAYRRKYHSKTIRKNVTMPQWLADLVSEANITFSQTLTDALKEKLRI